jgi:ribosomal protein S27AE
MTVTVLRESAISGLKSLFGGRVHSLKHNNRRSEQSSASKRRGAAGNREPRRRESGPEPPETAERGAGIEGGMGYCQNADCGNPDGVFLANAGEAFFCGSCGKRGKVETERGFHTGKTGIFKEVRVEYNFDPTTGRYREVAIVRGDGLPTSYDVYTLRSPLIKSKKRALRFAETLFLKLNHCRGQAGRSKMPRAGEIILSFDDDLALFRQRLQQLSAP